MASNSHSHAAEPGIRPKSKSVTAQHTLERVRNNQRRHRARRRDYIAVLEQKLSLAEQSVTALRDQVDALQAELAQFRNQVGQTASGCPVLPDQLRSNDGGRSPAPPPSPQEIGFQAFGLLPDVADLGILTLSTPLPIQRQLSDDLSVELGLDVISPHARPEDVDEPTEFDIPRALLPLAQPPNYPSETLRRSSSCSASDLALQTTDYQLTGGIRTLLSATATPDPATTTTGTCCSKARSSKPDDNKTDEHAVVLSRENSPLLPAYVVQPATGAYYGYNTEGESTMLCAEAYLLIAQQNFKGVSQKDVATWLWHGFRKSVRRDEGCRVKTDLLFSLLTFISDV
ncbi:hypothetical protein L207DRAFT_438098 [Hyaloscypha variabilis F]|uniref:BZIP domain-containing protein n=1 Tax=Hyaloscypha variabilis (strain UAMH 11265 / GT02V1 / F) TaxID=1149755 RepID=A0A2J6R4Y1_HYAVF|nr:hypothetical protein L207DRAFT_438098 [Hyaloscypha variabilis F]